MMTSTLTGLGAPLASAHLNYLAVLVCGVLNFGLGGAWYSALFAKAWLKAAKLDPEKMDKSGVGGMFALAAVTAVFVPLCMAYVFKLAHVSSTLEGLRFAWTIWLGFTVAATSGDYAFLRRGFALNAINNGLHLCTFTLSAVILSLWR